MRKGDRVVIVGVSRQGGKTQQLIDELREDLNEVINEIEERDEWARSLAAHLDVPEDLDPYFGIDRVARDNERTVREVARLIVATNDLRTDAFEALVADVLATKSLPANKQKYYEDTLAGIRAFDAAAEAFTS